MNRSYYAQLVALAMVTALLLNACANTVPQSPIGSPPKNPQSGTGAQIIQQGCAQNEDVDSDGDGICDKDEENDPSLGPKCVHNPDCNGNHIPDGDDESWWVKNRWTVIKVALAGLATSIVLKKCVFDGAPGSCGNNSSGTSSSPTTIPGIGSGAIGSSNSTVATDMATVSQAQVTDGGSDVHISNTDTSDLFAVRMWGKTASQLLFSGVDLGYNFGILLIGQSRIGQAVALDDTMASDMELTGDYEGNRQYYSAPPDIFYDSTFRVKTVASCGEDFSELENEVIRTYRSISPKPAPFGVFMGLRKEADGRCVAESLPIDSIPIVKVMFPNAIPTDNIARFQLRFLNRLDPETYSESAEFVARRGGVDRFDGTGVTGGIGTPIVLPKHPLIPGIQSIYWHELYKLEKMADVPTPRKSLDPNSAMYFLLSPFDSLSIGGVTDFSGSQYWVNFHYSP